MSGSLDFRSLTLSDAPSVRRFLMPNSEGSTQHSFVSMISLREKYGDEICFRDGTLYIHRSRLDTDTACVFLAPMPEDGYAQAGPEPWLLLSEHARSQGKKVRFHTLTDRSARLLESLLPGRFRFTPRRDLAEYIHSCDQLSSFSGHALAEKRSEVRKLRNTYGDALAVSRIRPDDFENLLRLERLWLASRPDEDGSLARESREIVYHLMNWDRLDLSGVIVRIGGVPVGFGYGTPICEDTFDSLIEKGDRQIPDICRLLVQEIARLAAGSGYRYLNREEDLGIPGMRTSKLLYRPEFLLEKFDAEEN